MSSETNEYRFPIQDVGCTCSADALEADIRRLEGVQESRFHFTTGKLHVVGSVERDVVLKRLLELGYDVVLPRSFQEKVDNRRPPNFLHFMWRRWETRAALIGAVLILPGLFFGELQGIHHPAINIASIGALVAAGYPIALSAWRTLRSKREITINMLMTIASVGAVFIGAYTEAGMVMVLFAIGEALENHTAMRARQSIRFLMEVVPDVATVLRQHGENTHEELVKVESLRLGDLILVKPGERIPMDGVVRSGSSSVNQAPITGESRLVLKTTGSKVFASSINGEGSLEIEVTHLAADNTISRLIKMVEEAQEKRAPTQRFVDRFARFYTPAVVILSILVAVVPPVFFGQPFLNPISGSFGWLYRGLALLVVACPCALVISTPVSIVSAISNAARSGVLVKGGAHLETLSKIHVVALDKTGTLTEGHPKVVAVRSIRCSMLSSTTQSDEENLGCDGCDDVVALASAVERYSEHPLARAIVREAVRRESHDRYPTAAYVTADPGRGVNGRVDGNKVVVGSHAHFDRAFEHPESHCEKAVLDAEKGYMPIMVSQDGEYQGTITLADAFHEASRDAILGLRDVGIRKLVMLTGDNASTAESIAARVGITDVRSESMPEDKVAIVEALKDEYGQIAMVGDGINDAPALTAADVGIAVGGATAQVMETADITLMSGGISQLPFVFQLSRATMRTITTNVVLSLSVKIAFLGLVLVGLGTMWMAVLADMGTSLLVTLNGMRLLRYPTGVVDDIKILTREI
jgi:Cd2+/Zn2+-exporting ATPase